MLDRTASEAVAHNRIVVGSVIRVFAHYLFVQWAAARNVACSLLRVSNYDMHAICSAMLPRTTVRLDPIWRSVNEHP